jgi:hypothetical protein
LSVRTAQSQVRVVYRKYDGSLHWHMTADRLGSDEYGTWLGAPAGTEAQRGSEAPVTIGQSFVRLIPHSGAWTMNCNAAPAWTEIYIDVTTAPRWVAADHVEMIDLDLDVVRFRDGSAEILDIDEFAEHQIRYWYPPDVIQGAEQTAARMLEAVTSHAEPFESEAVRGLRLCWRGHTARACHYRRQAATDP